MQEAMVSGTTTVRPEKTEAESPDGKAKAPQVVHTIGTQAQLSRVRSVSREIFGKELNPTRNAANVPHTRDLTVGMNAGRLTVAGDSLLIKEAMSSIGPQDADGNAIPPFLWSWDSEMHVMVAVEAPDWPIQRIFDQFRRLCNVTGYNLIDGRVRLSQFPPPCVLASHACVPLLAVLIQRSSIKMTKRLSPSNDARRSLRPRLQQTRPGGEATRLAVLQCVPPLVRVLPQAGSRRWVRGESCGR